VLGVRWSQADAPDQPVCVRAVMADGDTVADVSAARGNVVLADHGVTYDAVDITPAGWGSQGTGAAGTAPVTAPLRLTLPQAPLTFQVGPLGTDRTDLSGPPEAALPALQVTAQPDAGPAEVFTPVPDLFDSGPNDLNLVVEVDDTGHGLIRFGDGSLGRFPADAAHFLARYRVGNGTAGNIGAEGLAHIALPGPDVPVVSAVRNPLAAAWGTDPETAEHARQMAPGYFRAQQARAVTQQDAAAAVLALPGVRAAVAALRWTGSWYTWLIAVLPADSADLVAAGGTRLDLSAALRAQVIAALDLVRLCGHDVEVRPPTFVGVELGLHVCAVDGQSRAALRTLVRDALIAPARPGGGSGLLTAATLAFGQAIELGEVYAAVAALPGVNSVRATLLRRYQQPDNGELGAGRLVAGPWEILRLDNDPSLPSRGVLYLTIDGGAA
jgi:predicted phage baseplate assembly protein